MAIIKVTNPEIFQAWLRYFEVARPDMAGYEKRTYAFFRSEKGEHPPGNY